jgi:DNA modification methylase
MRYYRAMQHQIVMRGVDTIRPYPENAKKHSSKQIHQVADSIKEFGFNQPVVVDKDGVIIVGHGRFAAAQVLGMTEVPTIVAEDLTEEQAKAYRLADNKLNESPWDMKLVIPELKSLSAPMLDLTGFPKGLVIESEPEDDNIPSVDIPPTCQVGDLYQLGEHRLYVGDSTLVEAAETLFGEQLADMIFTDPPYNVDYVGKTKDALTIENDHKSEADFLSFLQSAFGIMAAFSKRGGVAYICHADSSGHLFRQAFRDAGFLLKQCLIWNKNSMVLGRQDYHWKHEPILYGWKDGASHTWYGTRSETTVWDIPRPSKSEQHPTMKPVELVQRALENSSKDGDIVFDPFLGSGSTLIACQKTGRRCFGFELDPRYADRIVQRYCEYVGSAEIIVNGEPRVWNTP